MHDELILRTSNECIANALNIKWTLFGREEQKSGSGGRTWSEVRPCNAVKVLTLSIGTAKTGGAESEESDSDE